MQFKTDKPFKREIKKSKDDQLFLKINSSVILFQNTQLSKLQQYNHFSRSNNYSVLGQYRRENNTADTEQKTQVFLQTYKITNRKLHHGRH
jgi:hypothetical protein